MKIRIVSDLHLETFIDRDMSINSYEFIPYADSDSESLLVLAGDISGSISQLDSLFDLLSIRFKKILYVPGNHEYYRENYHQWNKTASEVLSKYSNCIFALGEVRQEVIEGVRFIFGTLWADGGSNQREALMVDHGLNDFRVIWYEGRRFSVYDMQFIHKEQKAQLKTFIEQPFDGKTVVVTHHMPTYRLCHPRFGNEINGGFASNCEDIIAYDHAPDVWIFGHTHDTNDDVMWKTRFISNPKGYVGEFRKESNYNDYFDEPKVITI